MLPPRLGQAEWGAIPREWVTVKPNCSDKSDTPERLLGSCLHRECQQSENRVLCVCVVGASIRALFVREREKSVYIPQFAGI